MHRIAPIFIQHGLPKNLLDLEDKGEKNIDHIKREFDASTSMGDELRHNISVVIKFAVDIENHLSRIISSYLVCVDRDRQEFLDEALIRASWCTSSIKSELALKILEATKLTRIECTSNIGRFFSNTPIPSQLPVAQEAVTKGEISEVRKKIKEVTRWRNALAHGLVTVTEDDPPRFVVNFFGQKQEQQELDDAFWEMLESRMIDLADFVVSARRNMEIRARKIRLSISKGSNNLESAHE